MISSRKLQVVSLFLLFLLGSTNNSLSKENQDKGVDYSEPPYTSPVLEHQKIGLPAKNSLNEAQIEFWRHLWEYNRKPTEQDLKSLGKQASPLTEKIWQVLQMEKPYIPPFVFLDRAEKSIIGNKEELQAHKPIFIKRYPWISNYLQRHQISLQPAIDRFHINPDQIIDDYNSLFGINATERYQYDPQKGIIKIPGSEKEFPPDIHIQHLFTLDFLTSRGSQNDQQLASVMFKQASSYWSLDRHTPFPELRKQAVKTFFWPLAVNKPILIDQNTTANISSMLKKSELNLEWLAFRLYLIEYPQIPLESIESSNRAYIREQITLPSVLHNFLIEHGFVSYAIYLQHLHNQPTVRPQSGKGNSPERVIKTLFKNLYGNKEYQKPYQNYSKLLNASYPPTNDGAN